MDRDFRRGRLEIDFPVEPFCSAPALLVSSARLFFRYLAPLTMITIAVFLPGKALLQFFCSVFEIRPDGVAAYLLMDASDLVLGALAAPAAIFLLVAGLRGAKPASIRKSLLWGRLLWRRMLWNKFKVEMTVAFWSLLLIVPGILAMLRLALVEPALAVEAAAQPEPLRRSEELTAGRRGRIFLAFLPLAVLGLAAEYLSLELIALSGYSRLVIASVETLEAVAGQFGTAVALMIYLGVTGGRENSANAEARRERAA